MNKNDMACSFSMEAFISSESTESPPSQWLSRDGRRASHLLFPGNSNGLLSTTGGILAPGWLWLMHVAASEQLHSAHDLASPRSSYCGLHAFLNRRQSAVCLCRSVYDTSSPCIYSHRACNMAKHGIGFPVAPCLAIVIIAGPQHDTG